MNIAIKNGIALDRWCKYVTVMIEKDIGVPKIHRIRVIHLYEGDYNLFLKLQWGSRLVKHGEKHKGLNGGSFGIASLPLPTASLISAIVFFSTLLLPLTLLLTSLGLMSFPFLILPFAFSDQSPFQTLLPTLPVVLLPSAK